MSSADCQVGTSSSAVTLPAGITFLSWPPPHARCHTVYHLDALLHRAGAATLHDVTPDDIRAYLQQHLLETLGSSRAWQMS